MSMSKLALRQINHSDCSSEQVLSALLSKLRAKPTAVIAGPAKRGVKPLDFWWMELSDGQRLGLSSSAANLLGISSGYNTGWLTVAHRLSDSESSANPIKLCGPPEDQSCQNQDFSIFDIRSGEVSGLLGQLTISQVEQDSRPAHTDWSLETVPAVVWEAASCSGRLSIRVTQEALSKRVVCSEQFQGHLICASLCYVVRLRIVQDCLQIIIEEEGMEEQEREVPIEIVLGTITMPLNDFLRLRPGAKLECTRPETLEVVLQLGGSEWARAQLHVEDDRLTVELAEIITLSNPRPRQSQKN